MITENAWPVDRLQDITRVACARRPLSCRSQMPRLARKGENPSPQPRQGRAMGLRVGSRDLPNAGRTRTVPV